MKEMAFPATIDSRAFLDFCGVDFRNQVPDGDTEALNSRVSNSISCLL